MKTALVIGATGLVGSQLVALLLADERFASVKVFARRSTGLTHPKLEEHLISFDDLPAVANQIAGDVLFSTLGTTLRKAGSQAAQYKIDYTYQYQFAEMAFRNGVVTYVLVSSLGASVKSRIFYSRMKGELERDVKKLGFPHLRIVQPGLLVGPRPEVRPMEKVGAVILGALTVLPGLKNYRPIPVQQVAQALIQASLEPTPGVKTYAGAEVFSLAAPAVAQP